MFYSYNIWHVVFRKIWDFFWYQNLQKVDKKIEKKNQIRLL